MGLEWLSDERFRVGTTEFVDSYQSGSTAELFHIRKPRDLVEAYVEVLQPYRGANVVELGIAQGGSVALMELVAAPSTLVALELAETPVTGLIDFIEQRGAGDRIHPYFGVDQSDRPRVLEIVTGELHGAPLDLVIDDASHLLGPTRTSFETLFPLLRPGGRYLIEDWSWQYQMDVVVSAGITHVAESMEDQFRDALAARLQDPDPAIRARQEADLVHAFPDPDDRRRLIEHLTGDGALADAIEAKPPPDPDIVGPLPSLAIDLMLARATSGDIVADVHVDGFWIWATRGPAPLDPETFCLADTFTDHQGLRYRP